MNFPDTIVRINTVLRTDAQSLQQQGANRVIICGIYMEFCVGTPTRRSPALAYPVTLVTDAHIYAGNPAISQSQIKQGPPQCQADPYHQLDPRVDATPVAQVEIAA